MTTPWTGWAVYPAFAYAGRQADELERTRAHGRTHGHSGTQVDDIIATWSAWSSTTPWPVDWDRIRDALTEHPPRPAPAPDRVPEHPS